MLSPLGRLPSSPSSARLVRRGRFVIAGLCLLLAVVTALGSSRPASSSARPRGRPVVVATRDLPAGHALARGDVAVRMWPPLLPAGAAATGLPGVLGERLASPLRRGEPVTTTRLISGDLTAGLPAGMVATSIPLAASTAGLVHSGDHVDVVALAAMDAPPANGVPPARNGADVVARRVLVLASLHDTADVADVAGSRLVIATTRTLAVRLAGLTATHEFAVVVESF